MSNNYKQIKTNEAIEKKSWSFKSFSDFRNTLTKETKNELNKVKDIEKLVDRENLVYETN